jgi:hypothetical protein
MVESSGLFTVGPFALCTKVVWGRQWGINKTIASWLQGISKDALALAYFQDNQ